MCFTAVFVCRYVTIRVCFQCLRDDLVSVTPLFHGSHHICQAEPKPSMSVAPHPINYQLYILVSCSVPQASSARPVEFFAYTEDVSEVFNRHGIQYRLYADDKQAYVDSFDTLVSDVPTAHAALQSCILDVGDWCSSRQLQLNGNKKELNWFHWF